LSLDTSQLRKILSLENTRHNDNTSVIGGLDRYLKNWANRNLPLISNPKLVQMFNELYPTDFSYASLSIERRRIWISQLVNLISEIETPQRIHSGTVKKVKGDIDRVKNLTLGLPLKLVTTNALKPRLLILGA